MKVLICLVVCACAVASAREAPPSPLETTAFDYHRRFGIPLADKIRALEEEAARNPGRIVGGSPAALGQFPHQAALLAQFGQGQGVCGGSLVSANRVLTAAHCWFDGVNRATSFTVVLGSITLFSGGTRLQSSDVIMHANWSPALIRNDIAIIRLGNSVTLTVNIQPIALPSGSQLSETYAGETATASGFGLKEDGGSITSTHYMSHASMPVISNNVCSLSFPIIVQASNICTSGAGGRSTCQGDSGGPLTVQRNGRPVLIGITSFGSARGCQFGSPAAFVRVTSFMDFINQHF